MISTKLELGKSGTFVRQASWMLAATIVGQIVAIGTMAIIASTIPVEDFGRLVTALAAQSLVAAFTHNGLRHPLIRELTVHDQQFDRHVSSYVAICILVATTTTLVTVGVVLSIDIPNMEKWVWIAISIGNLASALQPNPIYDALRKPAATTIVASVNEIIAFIVITLLYRAGKLDLITATLVIVAKWCLTTMVLWCLLRIRHRRIRVNIHKDSVFHLLRSGLWVGGTVFMNSGLNTTLPILARWLGGSEAAALVGVGYYAYRAHQMLFNLLNRLISPVLAKRVQQAVRVSRILFLATIVSITLAVVGWLAASILVPWVLPKNYEGVVGIIGVLLVAASIRHAAQVGHLVLVMQRRERTSFCITIVTTMVFGIWCVFPRQLLSPQDAADALTLGLVLSAILFAVATIYVLQVRSKPKPVSPPTDVQV